jgi:hypothetical protein
MTRPAGLEGLNPGPRDDLPAGPGGCSIEFADQAADVRPFWVERTRRKSKETSS